MDNRQKPSSKVWSAVDHNSLDTPLIGLQQEMLAWPIMSFYQYPEPCTPCPNEARNTILRRALAGLMQLPDPFMTVVSLEIDREHKRIAYAKRTWAEIMINGHSIVRFSHHSKKNNVPFGDLADWVEMEEKPHTSEEEWRKNRQETLDTLALWTITDWNRFFKQKIIDRAVHLQQKAKKKRGDAERLEESATEILLYLIPW